MGKKEIRQRAPNKRRQPHDVNTKNELISNKIKKQQTTLDFLMQLQNQHCVTMQAWGKKHLYQW